MVSRICWSGEISQKLLASRRIRLTQALSHAFCRGAAQLLEQGCSVEDRTWAMGYYEGSNMYMQAYKSQTATFDIRGVMRDLPEKRDMLIFSSMSLGRTEAAPQT